jgi:ribosomal protein L13E
MDGFETNQAQGGSQQAPQPGSAVTPETTSNAQQLPGETEVDFTSALRAEMQDRLSVPEPQDGPLPAGLVANAADQILNQSEQQDQQRQQQSVQTQTPQESSQGAMQSNATEAQDPNTQPESEKSEGVEDPEKTQTNHEEPEPITAVKLDKFGREFSISEIEAAIEGFNYYHPKAMKLQEDLQRFKAEKQQFEGLKKSPEFQLTEMLKKDPDLKARVLQTVRGYNPETAGKYQATEAEAKLQGEIDQLKQQLNENKKSEEQRRLQQQQEARRRQQNERQQEIVSVSKELDNAVTQKLEALKSQGVELSDQDLNLIAESATAQIKSRKMQYKSDQLISYFHNMMDHLAGRVANARQQAVGNYQAHKRNLPPPPPSGGAAPVVGPDAPTLDNFEQTFANRLEMVLGNL